MSLYTVHLEHRGERIILPSLEMLRFLKRLKLRNMQTVREVSVPSLEGLVLDGMPDLQRCSCTSVRDMKSMLRVLEIQNCPALEVFDLFQKGGNYEIEHKSWLPSLRKLIVCDCPRLQVHTALPPSATFSELSISEVSTIMAMEGSSIEKLKISGDKLLCDTLDDKILAFHNLNDIKYLEILNCKSLTSISFKGLSQLISLKSFKIVHCKEFFSLDDVLEQTHDNMIIANEDILPALESLDIIRCGITGKWLSLMLRHSPTLKELYLYECPQLKQLKIEEEGNVQPNLLPAFEASSSGYADGVVHIPLNLRKIKIGRCPHIIFDGSREGFAGFTSSSQVENGRCLLPQSLEHLDWSDYSRETLLPSFVGNLMWLKKLNVRNGRSLQYLKLDSCKALEELEIRDCNQLFTLEGMRSLGILVSLKLSYNSRLKSLQLHSCTSLEHLEIWFCSSLVTLESLRSLVNLKHLEILDSPALDSLTALESTEPTGGISSHSHELFFPALESLAIDDLSPLNMSFCKGLTCLQSLSLGWFDATRLTDDQERALLLLRSLQELEFKFCHHLVELPTGLRGLPSLKTLRIISCNRNLVLSNEGLPPSLEELAVNHCHSEFTEKYRLLATSKLDVKVDGRYVD
ncbi:unnamed protein product [Triticum turgidum subsp. durum]|uniref:Uncharacterized protein n=1 Tax=Triticum turgidum subsp. durum TaxID=4567 RepID=A0A9R0Z038_TRITD|nr:unnamed protein product [Triticum turgidum subsp. durum]